MKTLIILVTFAAQIAFAILPTDTGGGGLHKEAQYKNIGFDILDTLSREGVRKVKGIKLSDLRSALDSARVDYKENDRVQFGNKDKDAVYDGLEDIIRVSYTFFLIPDLFLQRQNVIHEGLRRMKKLGLTKKSDDGYNLSHAIISKAYSYMKDSPHDRNLSPGWTVLHVQEPKFTGQQQAINTCQSMASPYLEEYKYVLCEPMMKKENKVIAWTDYVYEQRFVGMARSYSSESGSFFESWKGLSRVFVSMFGILSESGDYSYGESYSSTSYSEDPVYEDVAVERNNKDEYELATFGYRILVNTPLVKNRGDDGILMDGAEQALYFDNPMDSIKACAEYVFNMRKFDYEARCENYLAPNGQNSFKVLGKNKFVQE